MFEWIKSLFCFKVKPTIPFAQPLCAMCKIYKPIITKDMGDEFCFTCVAKRAREVLGIPLEEKPQKKYRLNQNIDMPVSPSVQEDPRVHESIKRTRSAFKQQQCAMDMRAMKSHAAECNDPWTCVADPCFVIEPDKIVNKQLASQAELDRYNDIRKKNRTRYKKMNKVRASKHEVDIS